MNEELKLLSCATLEERRGLAALLGSKSSTPEGILFSIQQASQSLLGRMFSSDPTYRDIVLQCLEKLGVTSSRSEPISILEAKLVHKVLGDTWSRLTPVQREKMQQEMSNAAALEGIDRGRLASLGPIAALSAAQLSGFGIYLFATTALSVTGVVGITLPFAAYTAMTSAISVVIGPVGWIGAGLFAIWSLTGPDYKKLIPAVLMIAALRDKYSPRTPPRKNGNVGWLRWVIVGIGVIGFAIWQLPSSPPTPAASNPATAAAKPSIGDQNAGTGTHMPQQASRPPDRQSKPRAAVASSVIGKRDMRHCLNLATNAEIARCASRQ